MAAGAAEAVDLAKAMNLAATPLRDWLVIVPVVLPIVAGAVCVMLRNAWRLQPVIAIAVLLAVAAADAALLGRALTEGPVVMVMGRWLPPFGIAFTVDVLGALFALAAALVTLAGALNGIVDIGEKRRRFGFYPFLLLMSAGVSGSFLTGDLFNLYVWFEVLLIASFGLLVLGGEPRQVDGTVKYGFLNLIATTLFLIATGYLYGLVGTLNMADIALKVRALPEGAPIATIAALFVVAFGMKAAAFPVNAWLPASYHTPKITVAAVFAGLLTKVGAYALLRVLVMLMPAERVVLADLIGIVAALTMLSGALFALAQAEIRRALGFLVISGIGYIFAGLAIGGTAALSGATFYAVHSMLAMSAAYLAVGAVERYAGTSMLGEVGGLWRAMPLCAALFLMVSFAIAGLPPFSGFWPKAMLVSVALEGGWPWLAGAMLGAGFLSTLALGRIWLLAFWKPAPAGFTPQGDGGAAIPAATLVGLGGLTLLVVAIGLAPEPLAAVARQAATGLIDPAAYLHAVFPGGR